MVIEEVFFLSVTQPFKKFEVDYEEIRLRFVDIGVAEVKMKSFSEFVCFDQCRVMMTPAVPPTRFDLR